MTTIRPCGRSGLLRLLDRWLGPKQPVFTEIDPIELEGFDGHLKRDIGLSLHSDDYPRRDILGSDGVGLQ
jgi:hypothetical protein